MVAAGSKWTARETTLGWRHFSVIDRRTTDLGTYALMEATCESDVTLWVGRRHFQHRYNLREHPKLQCLHRQRAWRQFCSYAIRRQLGTVPLLLCKLMSHPSSSSHQAVTEAQQHYLQLKNLALRLFNSIFYRSTPAIFAIELYGRVDGYKELSWLPWMSWIFPPARAVEAQV